LPMTRRRPPPQSWARPAQDGERRINVILNYKATVLFPKRHNVTVSRPDIAFAVNTVSKFLNNHNDEHWRAVKRIISYVSGTIEYGIEYFCSEKACELIGYSDADYANDIETRRSTTGYLFELANGPHAYLQIIST
jgi:hypothetical protein